MYGVITKAIFPADLSSRETSALVGASSLFLVLTAVSLASGVLWLLLAPLALLLVMVLIQNSTIMIFLILVATPFSVEMIVPGTGSALQIPTEPMILLLLGFWVLELLYRREKEGISSRITQIPRLFLGLFILTILGSILFSLIPIHSVKMSANMLWYASSCFFFVRRRVAQVRDFVPLFIAGFISALIVATYTIFRHAAMGFGPGASNAAPYPFFTEHGSYAAYLALMFGPALGLAITKSGGPVTRSIAWLTAITLFFAVVFSYTRAAWVGIAVVLALVAIVRSKDLFKLRTFIVIIASVVILAGIFVREGVNSSLERNAASVGDLEQNISNLERLNRWVAALNIIKSHPLTGVGLGVYPDAYERYRDPQFETPISGIYAMAHNDYLLYFAEGGVLCFASWTIFVVSILIIGIRAYFRLEGGLEKGLVLGCVSGILTYAIHALFNDFLIIDKVAVPFWIEAACILALADRLQPSRNSRQSILMSPTR